MIRAIKTLFGGGLTSVAPPKDTFGFTAGAAIAAGAAIKYGATAGKVIKASPADSNVIGIALEAATLNNKLRGQYVIGGFIVYRAPYTGTVGANFFVGSGDVRLATGAIAVDAADVLGAGPLTILSIDTVKQECDFVFNKTALSQ